LAVYRSSTWPIAFNEKEIGDHVDDEDWDFRGDVGAADEDEYLSMSMYVNNSLWSRCRLEQVAVVICRGCQVG
jgi:hypothetical protein